MEARVLLTTSHPDHKDNYLQLKLFHRKETTSWSSYKPLKKGYVLNCVPIQKRGIITEFGAFTGFNLLLVECARKSKGNLQLAKDKANEKLHTIIEYFETGGYTFEHKDELLKNFKLF